MKIAHQVALYFIIFMLLVLAGMGVMLNRVFTMNVAHQRLIQEWKELQLSINLLNTIDELISQTSLTESTGFPDESYMKKVTNLISTLEQIRGNSTKPEVFEEDTHVMIEENEFLDIRQDFENFAVAVRKLPRNHALDEPTRNLILQRLNQIREAGVKLQEFYMESMADASAYAQRARRQILSRTIIVFVTVLGLLAITGGLFVYLVNKNTRAMLAREKGLTIGLLAQSLAHEIRNPLGIIQSSASVIRKKLPPDCEEFEISGYLSDEVDRIDQLIGQLLQFRQEAKPQIRPQNPLPLIEQVLGLMRNVSQKNSIRIEFSDEAGVCEILCDSNQFKQVLINIMLNAIQASPSGSSIFIRTLLVNRMYQVQVHDSGVGFKKEDLKKAFDSFFSTKESGLGLGLFVVKNIMDAHGGTINFYPNHPRGTTVILGFKLKG